MANLNEIRGGGRLDSILSGLIGAVSPAGRRQMLSALARRVRSQQAARIAKNVTPDGEAFEARKPRPGGKKGRMFARLKTARWLKRRVYPDAIKIVFASPAAEIARIHHYGLRAKLDPKYKKRIKYPERPLLGVTEADENAVEDLLIDAIRRQARF